MRFLVRTWVGGATMSHLSFGMTALAMKGATFFRVLSVVMRMGAASAIVAQYEGALRLAYIWDLCWMTVILSLTVRKALCGGGGSHDTKNPLDVAADDGGNGAGDGGGGGGGLQSRLVHRVRKQRRESQMVQIRSAAGGS